MLFLGAGASTPFNKPVTKDFKERLYKDFPDPKENGLVYHLIHHAMFEDIEHVLDCANKLTEFGNNTPSGTFLKALGQYLIYRQAEGYEGKGFHELVKQAELTVNVIKQKIHYVYRWDFAHDQLVVDFYKPLFDFLKSKSELMVGTTNYDRAIEQFCQQSNYSYNDGFTPSINTYYWKDKFYYPSAKSNDSITLYKIHGSLGWKKLGNNIERSSDASDLSYAENMLIYPTLSPKEQEDEDPYRTIIYEFGQMLSKCDVCIVIGYSFRDESVNKFIREFLLQRKKLIIIDRLAEKNLRSHFAPPQVDNMILDQDHSITLPIGDDVVMVDLVPDYAQAENIQDIVKRISGFMSQQ